MTNDIWPAPAKLNLFLHITGQRPDGYHELQTVFQFLDYGDSLQFSLRDDGRVRRVTDINGLPESEDLVVRAAMALREYAQAGSGVDIRLNKILPTGGGLGGGSSDAATTLVAMNHLWQVGLDEDELVRIGLALGADVPVFIRGHAAWAEGVGERLEPVDLSEPWYVIIHPGVHVSTQVLFAAPELTRDVRPITIRDYLAGGAVNVFETPVKSRFPEVAEALDWLTENSGRQALMTGTGSCIFAALDDESEARQLTQNVPRHWMSFCAQGLNQSPLIRCLQAQDNDIS